MVSRAHFRQRAGSVLLCGLLGVAGLLGGHRPAAAQPAVNPGALDTLQPTPRPRTPPSAATPRPEAKPDAPKPGTPKPAAPKPDAAKPTARPNAPARPAPAAIPAPPRPPAVPVAPPAIAAIPPVIAVPVQPAPEPPPIPVTADAPGVVSAMPGGVRATFGADRADINAATETAIRSFARPLRDTEQAVNVLAYAAGSADDPSTPRRLSLARALAARAVLIAEGIPSTRIYVRALGPTGGDGPPDRVDLSVNAPPAGIRP